MAKNSKIIGSFEKIGFPEFGVDAVVAKVDTGAHSGALHATGMTERKNKKGETILYFHPLGKENLKASSKKFDRRRVRSSNGLLEERYLVQTIIVVNGEPYAIEISLTDRSNMTKEVLLGRKFLHRYHFLVDVRKGTQYRYAVKG